MKEGEGDGGSKKLGNVIESTATPIGFLKGRFTFLTELAWLKESGKYVFPYESIGGKLLNSSSFNFALLKLGIELSVNGYSNLLTNGGFFTFGLCMLDCTDSNAWFKCSDDRSSPGKCSEDVSCTLCPKGGNATLYPSIWQEQHVGT